MTLGATAEVLTAKVLLDQTDSFSIPAETKWSYVTSSIPPEDLRAVRYEPERPPKAGDVVVGRVQTIGRHTQVELPSGRKSRLFHGDVLGLVCGNRYATDQFEGYVPKALGLTHLLSVGGTCGEVISRSSTCPDPTCIELLGYVHSSSGPVSLRNYGLSPVPAPDQDTKVVVVTGNSMNSGKTTTAVHLIRGFVRQGFKVAAGKLTGTGCGNDPFQLADAGAHPVLDFHSAGYESTYLCSDADLLNIYRTVRSNLVSGRPDFVVLEVADGLLQRETASLLGSAELRGVDYVIHCVSDPLSARGAVDLLRQRGLNTIALSGVLSSRPLAIKEVAMETNLPVLSTEQLAEGCVLDLMGFVRDESERAMSAA